MGRKAMAAFMPYADTPLGLLVLFGFTWSLAFHFCNGIRHLAWDLGYGFRQAGRRPNSVIILVAFLLGRAGDLRLRLDRPRGYLQ